MPTSLRRLIRDIILWGILAYLFDASKNVYKVFVIFTNRGYSFCMSEKLHFTEEQVSAMFHTRAVIQAVDDALHGRDKYVPQEGEDELLAKFSGMESLRKVFHDDGWRSRLLDITPPGGERQDVYLQRYCGDPK